MFSSEEIILQIADVICEVVLFLFLLCFQAVVQLFLLCKTCEMFHNLCYFSCSCTSTYPIVNDRWGTTDIATLSLHLILFSASLTALQNFNPVHSEILFSIVGPFFSLLALFLQFLVKLSLQALMILIHSQITLTCVSLPWLRYHHRAQWLA